MKSGEVWMNAQIEMEWRLTEWAMKSNWSGIHKEKEKAAMNEMNEAAGLKPFEWLLQNA